MAVAIVRAVHVPFLVFVLPLGVVVPVVMRNGVAERMGALSPSGSGLAALLGFRGGGRRAGQCRQQSARNTGAGFGRADRGEHRPLLDLRRIAVEPVVAQRLRQCGGSASVGEYTRFGLCTVPTALLTAVLALWAGVRLMGI
jgi:arsenical pump membrane protein